MKKELGTIMLLLAMLIAAIAQAQIKPYKVIHWVHGLNGSAQSWASTAMACEIGAPGFPARQVVSDALIQYTQTTAQSSAQQVGIQISGFLSQSQNPYISTSVNDQIVIGHSQGGIVSRLTYKQNAQVGINQFQNIVTFNTSHGGAQILNNIDPKGANMLEPFLNNACNSLSEALVLDEIIGQQYDIVLNIKSAGSVTQRACNFLGGSTLEAYIDDYLPGISDFYKVGSPDLADLNNYAMPSVNKVAFYGVENQGQHFWRVLASDAYNQQNTPQVAFGNNDDGKFVNQMQEAYNRYSARAYVWEEFANSGSPIVFVNGTPFLNSTCVDIARSYKRAKDWIYTSNRQWLFIIGALKQVDVTNGYECQCEGNGPFGIIEPTIVDSPIECYQMSDQYYDCTPFVNTYMEEQYEDSDGVVTVSSQTAFPGAITKKIIGCNHQEARNSFHTRNTLYQLFEGNVHPNIIVPIK